MCVIGATEMELCCFGFLLQVFVCALACVAMASAGFLGGGGGGGGGGWQSGEEKTMKTISYNGMSNARTDTRQSVRMQRNLNH